VPVLRGTGSGSGQEVQTLQRNSRCSDARNRKSEEAKQQPECVHECRQRERIAHRCATIQSRIAHHSLPVYRWFLASGLYSTVHFSQQANVLLGIRWPLALLRGEWPHITLQRKNCESIFCTSIYHQRNPSRV